MENEIMSSVVYQTNEGTPVTDSLKVASVFGKKHKNIIQSIKGLLGSAEFSANQNWFLESTFEEKLNVARRRVEQLKEEIIKQLELCDDIEFVSTFDVNEEITNEAVAMGNCIRQVLECDAIFLDDFWKKSNGCLLEANAACVYRIKCFTM